VTRSTPQPGAGTAVAKQGASAGTIALVALVILVLLLLLL
jgi:hypothetical protein